MSAERHKEKVSALGECVGECDHQLQMRLAPSLYSCASQVRRPTHYLLSSRLGDSSVVPSVTAQGQVMAVDNHTGQRVEAVINWYCLIF